jgi:hypothetical protein
VTVDTPLDVVDFNDGVTSLREAIFATNLVGGADEIVFDFGHDGPETILLTLGELTITGPGADLLTIDASQRSRVFNLDDPTTTIESFNVTISGLTLTGGMTTANDSAGAGGAIRSLTRGQLTLTQSIISGNITTGRFARGGGIYASATVILTQSFVSGNSTLGASAYGGGILSFSDLILTDSTINGNSTKGSGALSGGIYARGDMTLTKSTVSGNSTAGIGADGGGIFGVGVVTLYQSTVSDNSTSGQGADGGGILARGAITLSQSTVSGNSSASSGGGIRVSGGALTLIKSTVSGNSTTRAFAVGGGINASNAGVVTLIQSTLSGNSTTGFGANGGGIAVTGAATFFYSTITDNHARWHNANGGATGGGIWSHDGPIEIRGSILAGNTAGLGSPNLAKEAGNLSVNYSLIGDTLGSGINLGTGVGNLLGVNPKLTALADNGGPTLTHALLPGSPAINRGDLNALVGVNGVPEFDQRGAPFARIFGGRIDIGAYEYQATSDLNLLVDTLVDESDGDYSRGDLSLREAIELANLWGGHDTIEFDPSLTAHGPATISLATVGYVDSGGVRSALRISDDTTIIGPGADHLAIDAAGLDPTPDKNNGDGSRIFRIDDGSGFFINVTITGVTLTGGDVQHPFTTLGGGGAIHSAESLSLANVSVVRNSANWGGAVWSSGSLTITNGTMSENEAFWDGGAVMVVGSSLYVTGTLVSNNSARFTGGGVFAERADVSAFSMQIEHNSSGSGAGVALADSRGTFVELKLTENTATMGFGGGMAVRNADVFVEDATIVQNVAARGGGGISFFSSNRGSSLTVVSSVVASNTAGEGGGGLRVLNGIAVVRNSSISNNVAGNSGGGVEIAGAKVTVAHSTITGNAAHLSETFGSGGGISLQYLSTTGFQNELHLGHSIVAGNTDSSGIAPDINATPFRSLARVLFTAQNSLIGDNSESSFSETPTGSPDVNGNLIGGPIHGVIDPVLSPLADNGGPTLTHALLPGSPAINAGNLNAVGGVDGVPQFDQRGDGFHRVFGGRIDIGAYELQELSDLNLLVDTLADESDGDYSRGDLSLREAIELANLWGGHDTIGFDPVLYAGGRATIVLTQIEEFAQLFGKSALRIRDDVTINGPGPELLTIDSSGLDDTPGFNDGGGGRSIRVDDDNQSREIEVQISGLTFTGGDSLSFGAGIVSTEKLLLSKVDFLNNFARSFGGALYVRQGHAVVEDSRISGNESLLNGGGISTGFLLQIFPNQLTIVASTIVDNRSRYNGGGVYAGYGNLTITGSYIANNYARYEGGGVFAEGTSAHHLLIDSSTLHGNIAGRGGGLSTHKLRAEVLNSTFSGNTAGGSGGGISTRYGGLYVDHSTVTENVASANGPNRGGGGGLFGFAVITHSIVAGNRDGSGYIEDIYGTVTANYSLIGKAWPITGYLPAVTGSNNLFGVDPLLSPLADNGGPTMTHALLPGSPAINRGDLNAAVGVNGVPEFDQRGAPFARIFGGRIDVGAFEYQATSDLNLLVDTLDDESDGDYSRGDLSLREAIELANLWGGHDTIGFDPALAGGTILLTMGELAITDSLTILGLGADLLTIDASGNDPTPDVNNGDGSRILNIDDGVGGATMNVELVGLRLTGGDVPLIDEFSGGGAIYSKESLSVTDSNISGNAAFLGGGIFTIAYGGTTRITASTISNNVSQSNSGGIRTYYGTTIIIDSTISGNSARADGGGISSLSSNTMTILGSTISGNSAGSNGGGIWSSHVLTVTNSIISDNSSGREGGGIRAFEGMLTVVGSTISGNSASWVGGGIGSLAVTTTITNTTISGNSAGLGGGGISSRGLTLSGSTISGNSAIGRGGGIYTAGASGMLTIVHSTISDNSAGGQGGGIWAANSVKISASTVSANLAGDNGGGIYQFFSKEATITDSTISGNSSRAGGVAFLPPAE